MKLLEQATRLTQECSGGYLSPTAVQELASSTGLEIDQLMLQLIPLAKTLAQPAVSGFSVGAVARGQSGALYLGANLEFAGCPLQLTVHAEQATVINAALHSELALSALAISAPPCGYCRQFLQELATASQLEILLADRPATKLSTYLPGAFGPADLGIVGGLLTPQHQVVVLAKNRGNQQHSAAIDLALQTAQGSYAPYTRALAAVVLFTTDGRMFSGPYLENAAFNPSISPIQAAAVALMLSGRRMSEVTQATVVCRVDSAIDHVAATRFLLEQVAPGAAIQQCSLEISETKRGEDMAKSTERAVEDLSFYFFDFDDNIMFVETPILIRNKATHRTKKVSTAEFARIRGLFGQPGDWQDFELFDDTYSHFRDIPTEKMKPKDLQHFVNDVAKAIGGLAEDWQRPSWPLFVHACQEQRPMAIITARGHSPETLQAGIRVLKQKKLIPREPNYLAIYAVGNEEVAAALQASVKGTEEESKLAGLRDKTSALKRIAIRQAVETALAKYGPEHEHRFGMSDDDPENVDLIVKAMCDCKKKYPDKRFFVINTHEGEWVKLEVFPVNYPVTGRAPPSEVIA
jgi:cytidine deaminase